MYNLEQLRMFVETAELGSFSACARKLGKVQSAISQGVANLEIDLDTPLFDRRTRKPTLTGEGERLLAYAKAVLLQANEFQSAAQALAQQEEVLIRLAVDSALLLPKLYSVLAEFEKKFVATDLELNSTTSTDVVNAIAQNKADVGLTFVEFNFNHDIELGYIGGLNFHPVCHPNHPLAQLDEISAGDLLPHRQIITRSSEGKAPIQLPLLSSKSWSSNSTIAMKSLVEKEMGWAYLPDYLVDADIEKGALISMKLAFDHKPWKLSLELVKPKNKIMGPALSWLYHELTLLVEA